MVRSVLMFRKVRKMAQKGNRTGNLVSPQERRYNSYPDLIKNEE